MMDSIANPMMADRYLNDPSKYCNDIASAAFKHFHEHYAQIVLINFIYRFDGKDSSNSHHLQIFHKKNLTPDS